MISLYGENFKAFMEFLQSAYPEHYKSLANQYLKSLNITIGSPLGLIWQEFDENCG